MKTKNNVQKTMLRFAAVVLSFVLVSYTVSARGFWERFLESSSFAHLASAMVASETATPEGSRAETDATRLYFETAEEANLELEAWMMDETRFGGATDGVNRGSKAGAEKVATRDGHRFAVEKVIEAPLELEEWMVSARVWRQ